MKEFLDIKNKIEEARDIILTAHVNPDGDAVGSGLGLYITLKKYYKEKNIKFVLQDNIPYTTKFLRYSDEIEKYDENKNYETDLLIFLDSATQNRTGLINEKVKRNFNINIDHHISNPGYGDINCVLPHMSSTSEIIYNFIKYSSYDLTLEAGEALYLGIVNDTGNFSHSNVKKSTMEMATDLIGSGVDNNKIVTNFLNSNSYSSLKILGEALTNFKFFEEKKLVYYYLDKKTMEKYSAKKEDTEGLVEKILSYTEASVSLFLRQEENGLIKGSMRSKKDIDVNKIANIFGGGGHIKAAGFSSDKNADEILKIILKEI